MDYTRSAQGLRVMGIIWIVLSTLTAFVWFAIGSDDLSGIAFMIAFVALFQGWLVGLGAMVLADMAPRRRIGN
ncbi:MAG: hypothetical protein ACR2HJ_05375 [Fimbriimonadales bacterium]